MKYHLKDIRPGQRPLRVYVGHEKKKKQTPRCPENSWYGAVMA
jgi:hypothetical protein